MSRKSSWWLRPQRKGASNRAALNEAKYFMEHNKVLRERINELAAENAKLRGMCVKALEWLRWAGGITCPPEVPDEFADELRELGVEVDK